MLVRRFPLTVMALVIAGSAVAGTQNFMRRSRAPYALGINVILYALSH
jgi:hypothetical protein